MEDANTNIENQNDSDSSESWTFVDNNLPKIENQNQEVTSTTNVQSSERIPDEQDEDTDGVAVITDDEEGSSTHDAPTASLDPPPIYQSSQFISFSPPNFEPRKNQDFDACSTATFRDSEEELPIDFYMANRKVKSYVHKRNNQISSLLNLVVVGALIIATTLAVGFTWGINDICNTGLMDSVGGMLSDLHKLQRENEMLKTKIRVLRTMKFNKPIQKDLNFDKYLEYQMKLDQEKIMPKFSENADDSVSNDIDKEAIEILEAKLHKENQGNNTNFLKDNSISEKRRDYKEFNFLKKDNPTGMRQLNIEMLKTVNDKPEVISNNHEAKQRTKREEPELNVDRQPSQHADMKSYCDDPLSYNDKGFKKKCLQMNSKHEAKKETKKDKYKANVEEKAKVKNKDEKRKEYKMDDGSAKKYKKDLKEKQKAKDIKKDKMKLRNGFDNEDFRVPENQGHHTHYNDNIKADWYQKMYDGRKEMRDKGFDEYDFLENKNKAKWYFKRMKDRETNRWNSGEKFYRRQMRKEYFKNKS